jgi:hypothetical protein
MGELFYGDNLADACQFLIQNHSDDSHINVANGADLSIRKMGEKIRGVLNPQAALVWDRCKPEGSRRRSPTSVDHTTSAGRPPTARDAVTRGNRMFWESR